MLAFALGGASCVWSDLRAARAIATPDVVVACNDVAATYPGPLDAFVTLHPDKIPLWIEQRNVAGFEPPKRVIADHQKTVLNGQGAPYITDIMSFRWPGHTLASGSSGLFCVKVAIDLLNADHIICCGMPMDHRPHFFDSVNWQGFVAFRRAWEMLPRKVSQSTRSMSGWTQHLLGRPDQNFLES